jgi:hypothetical protein
MSAQTTPTQDASATTAMPPQADYYQIAATGMWPWPKGFFDKTADELTERNQKQPPLLRIPVDVHLIIYEYAMGGERIQINGINVTTPDADESQNAMARAANNFAVAVGHGPKDM